MRKLTKAMNEDLGLKEDISKGTSKIPQKRKTYQSKKLTMAMDENWEFEENESNMDVHRKRKIRQNDGAKKTMNDSWTTVPHTLLSARKIAVGDKIKSKNIQTHKITSVKNLFKKNPDISIETTSLAQRKAKQIDLFSQTLPQVIKTTLKDYNSINFKAQAS
ncbi:MAG: hypothetical protein LBB05_02965 [Puniceicoccales bacterium]|jgi:hypothetical protein|nr:hypothetical protein [Puniceicoccales bacterium]